MIEKPPNGWKDLLTDPAIIAVVAGIILLILGSSPEFFWTVPLVLAIAPP